MAGPDSSTEAVTNTLDQGSTKKEAASPIGLEELRQNVTEFVEIYRFMPPVGKEEPDYQEIATKVPYGLLAKSFAELMRSSAGVLGYKDPEEVKGNPPDEGPIYSGSDTPTPYSQK